MPTLNLIKVKKDLVVLLCKGNSSVSFTFSLRIFVFFFCRELSLLMLLKCWIELQDNQWHHLNIHKVYLLLFYLPTCLVFVSWCIRTSTINEGFRLFYLFWKKDQLYWLDMLNRRMKGVQTIWRRRGTWS